MPVGFERYITSIANGQNGSPSHKIKIHHHFVHLPFISFYQYSTDSMKSQYFAVLSGVNKIEHFKYCKVKISLFQSNIKRFRRKIKRFCNNTVN